MSDITWTQPICVYRWNEMRPETPIDPDNPMYQSTAGDPCCFCGTPTNIYIRIDPNTVPFPRSV